MGTGFLGKHHTKRAKKKIGAAARKMWLNSAIAKRLLKSRKKSELKRVQKISKTMKLHWLNPENRRLASKKSVLAWSKPRSRKRQIEARRMAWKKPGKKKEWAKALKKSWKRHENKTKEILESQGWKVINKGWPDFICIRGKKVKFVEAKGPRIRVSDEQKLVHKILRKLGLIVEVISSDEENND